MTMELHTGKDIETDGWHPQVFLDGKRAEVADFSMQRDAKFGLLCKFLASRSGNINPVNETLIELTFGPSDPKRAICVSAKHDLEGDTVELQCILATQPLQIAFGGSISKVEGKLLNLRPSTCFKAVKLQTSHAEVLLSNSKASGGYQDAIRRRMAVVETGKFEVSPKSDTYGVAEHDEDQSLLWRFLRFVSGLDIGIGPWVAAGASNSIVALQPDVTRFDPLYSLPNWSHFYCHEELPLLFQLYQNACKDRETARAIDKAIEYYRASGSARAFTGIETGIILSQAALEVLSDFILSQYAGWSSELSRQVRGFHSKLAASSAFIGFRGELFDHAPDVLRAYKKENLVDSFHKLTSARNDITHAKPKVSLSGLELVQIWNASMFLVEIHLFFLFGYSGKMFDRRQLDGWFGTTIPAPISTASN